MFYKCDYNNLASPYQFNIYIYIYMYIYIYIYIYILRNNSTFKPTCILTEIKFYS